MVTDSGLTRVVNAASHVLEAAVLLRSGGLVAFPTETVYGLGADATSGVAVARIYEAKGRPSFNPLIVHVSDLAAAQREGDFGAEALVLANAFWPGPLTLVVPVAHSCGVSELARAGLTSVALRVPAHPIARDLIAQAGRPIAAPSANVSGHISPTLAAHVLADLSGRIELILDDGACAVGVESTICACLGGKVHILRPGAVTRPMIETALGRKLEAASFLPDAPALRHPISPHPILPHPISPRPVSPGQLLSHYAPKARVRLNATQKYPGEVFLDFGGSFAGADLDLSASGDLRTAAAALFAALRTLDAMSAATIAVAPIPHHGLGEAINERLQRAASGR